ncbi:RNA-binding protein S1 [Priestia megaterium]|nr:RNA-binding protein S1 [Priestia megaterium]
MSIEVGSKVKGKVTGIANFGAFVEMEDGRTGLVHISEVSHSYIKELKDHLKVGDEVEVKILGENNGKISLSIRQTLEKPASEESSYQKRPQRTPRPRRDDNRSKTNFNKPKESFDDKLARFLKSSDENISSLKRNTESKRGGRGGRRG